MTAMGKEHDADGVRRVVPGLQGITSDIARHDAKFCNVLWITGKNVVVSSYPPNIEMFHAISHRDQVRSINVKWSRFNYTLRSNSCWHRIRVLLRGESKILRKRIITKFIPDIDVSFSGWRIS